MATHIGIVPAGTPTAPAVGRPLRHRRFVGTMVSSDMSMYEYNAPDISPKPEVAYTKVEDMMVETASWRAAACRAYS